MPSEPQRSRIWLARLQGGGQRDGSGEEEPRASPAPRGAGAGAPLDHVVQLEPCSV
eukprot:CAMPEP_0185435508 /NCGR_PEP_ID=MMETSP1365-20130426/25136_1 /TAXON_ID=38817 /ORGANISM="Gephyrocapsa oceanica, Strain RCC1303" /LENGTH=55 /DNA_ID=CAMNT_0028040163 /DNA_START=1 /DNA_END=168 /DNA_ORIENTATION=-